MALTLLEDNDTSFKVKRDDGVVVPIAKTPDTMPIYKLVKAGAATSNDDVSAPIDPTQALQKSLNTTFAPPATPGQTPTGTTTPTAPADITTPTPTEPGANPPTPPDAPSNTSALPPNLTQTGTTQTSESPTSRQQASLDKLDASIKGAVTAKADADTMKSQLDLAQHTAEANIAQESNLKYQAFQEQRNKEIQDRQDKIKAVESKFDGMSIDGGRFFGDGITGSKVMAAIGLALGALGQGFTGKDYGVNDIINKAIDRDIEVQKANIGKVGKQVDLARGGLRDYLDVSNDMGTAITAEKARQLDAVGKQFSAIADGNSSAAIKSAAAQQAVIYQDKAAALNNQVGKNTVTQTVQTMPMKLDPVPEKVNEDVQKNIKASAALDRIRELKDAVGTGPVEGRINRLAAKFGLQGADTAELQQKLRENFISLVHDVGGARGFSDNERGFFENATLNDLMNSKVFDRLLDERQKEVEGTLNMHTESARQNGQRPINIEAQKRSYRDSSPQFSDQYFKPQGFKSGRK